MYFRYFIIISPWQGEGSLNPLRSRMLCAKFVWNWLSGTGEEDFKISSMDFRYFIIISPWKRAGPYIWTNLNSLQVWLKLTQLFWRRRFLNFINVPGIFAFFCYHLPSEKGAILHCNKLSSPLPKNGFCKVWFKLAHWIPTYLHTPLELCLQRGGG